VEISLGLAGGQSFTVIAGRLGRVCSTVSREVAANRAGSATGPGGRTSGPGSRPARPKARKLGRAVSFLLRAWWSPQQIAARLRRTIQAIRWGG
jgi:IS30 family transposase